MIISEVIDRILNKMSLSGITPKNEVNLSGEHNICTYPLKVSAQNFCKPTKTFGKLFSARIPL